MILIPLVLCATAASAIDLGAHVGYFDNNVKKAYVGADLMLPIGPVSIAPNIDYTKIGSAGLWWANGDVVFRFGHSGGPSFWAGAGPTYYYVTNAGQSGSSGGYSAGGPYFLAATNSTTIKEWGWDVNGGVGFSGTLRPYITARYNKIKQFKAGGVAVGLRFGH
jgi:hypothetical protein